MYNSIFSILLVLILSDVVQVRLTLEQKCPLLRLKNGQVRFLSKGKIARFNCMRSFKLVGMKYATCIRGQWDAEVPICVRPGCPRAYSSNANGQFFESYRGAVVKVLCNPGYSLKGSSTVYCNGASWNETFPICKAPNLSPPKSCDFETQDLCGWSQDPIHDIDWKRQNISSQSGYYMNIETSRPSMENDTARLYSPVFPAEYSTNACFQFSYFMHGEENVPLTVLQVSQSPFFDVLSGILRMYVKLENRELYNTIPSFWINGDQGAKWNSGFFQIEKTENPFQIVIEGVLGRRYNGDISFDNVNITESRECVVEEETTTYISTTSDMEDDGDDPLSCKNRCNQDPVYNGTSVTPEELSESSTCDCHNACVKNKTCCTDYDFFCLKVSEVPTKAPNETGIIISSTTQPSTTSTPFLKIKENKTTSEIKTVEVNKTKEKKIINQSTSAPNNVFTLKRVNGSNNNESNDIIHVTRTIPYKKVTMTNISDKSFDRVKISSTVKNTKVTVETTKTFSSKKTTIPIPFEKSTQSSKQMKSTTVWMVFLKTTAASAALPAQQRNDVKMPLLVNPSKHILESKPRIQDGKMKDLKGKDLPQAMKSDVEKAQSLSLTNIIGSAAALLALIAFIVGMVMIIIRRKRKQYERENMVEDSDVRFLTSDEVLDFTLARPADDDL